MFPDVEPLLKIANVCVWNSLFLVRYIPELGQFYPESSYRGMDADRGYEVVPEAD